MKGIKRFLFFCLVGGTGALIELISFNVFHIFFNFALSKLFGLILALSFNFSVNRNITFSASSGKKKKQILKYIIVYSLSISLNYLVSVSFNNFLNDGFFYSNLSVILGILAGLPINFFGSLYWVFNEVHYNKT